MDCIWEVMNWATALRIQGPNKSATKNMKRGPVKGRSHDVQLQILFQLPQGFAWVPLSFLRFVPLAVGPCHWLFLIGLHTSNILLLRRGRVLPFQLSIGLTPSYSVKPPQPGSLVGPVRPLKIWPLSQCHLWSLWISSVQVSHSVVSDSLLPHESQHARPSQMTLREWPNL